MKVKDVMHKGATWVPPETTVPELARLMRDQDIGAILVGESDRLIGMVTDRDITCRSLADGRDAGKLAARDVMTKSVLYCGSEEDIDDAIRFMRAKKVRRLPVINERKRLVGMLAIGDICAKVSRDVSGEAIRSVSAHHA